MKCFNRVGDTLLAIVADATEVGVTRAIGRAALDAFIVPVAITVGLAIVVVDHFHSRRSSC